MAEERSGIPLADVFRDANGSDLPSPRLRRGRQVRSELEMPLANLIRDTAHAVVEALGLEQKDVLVEGLATRWQRGTLVMQPADTSLQPKEVPLETFFHKIVMIRNNLRVLEQKVNATDKLSEADKFDLQQYITRCYGSLTTFNILFKNKDDQFRTSP